MSNECQGQCGQGVCNAAKLKEEAARKAPRFTREVIDEAFGSADVADAINKAEFGLYFLGKTDCLDKASKAYNAKHFPGLVAQGNEVAAGVAPRVDGVFFKDGEYFIVEGGAVRAFGSFAFHGGLSPFEVIGKFLVSNFRMCAEAARGEA